MTTQIQFSTFTFHSSAVRVITDPTGEHWFCGTDVCDILGYKNAPDALAKHCKQGGIAKRYTPVQCAIANRDITSRARKTQEMVYINEPNLYRLIIKSRKPEAEPFEAWVFEEVLPQIRKTGKYETQPDLPLIEQPKSDITISYQEAEQIAKYLLRAKAFAKEVEVHQRKLFEQMGIPRHIRNDLAAKGYDLAHEFNYWIDPFINEVLPQTKKVKALIPHR